MKREDVLKNMQELVGGELDPDDIICAFGDFEEEEKSCVIFEKSHNNGYDYIAYIDSPNSTAFYITVNVEADEDDNPLERIETIRNVWI